MQSAEAAAPLGGPTRRSSLRAIHTRCCGSTSPPARHKRSDHRRRAGDRERRTGAGLPRARPDQPDSRWPPGRAVGVHGCGVRRAAAQGGCVLRIAHRHRHRRPHPRSGRRLRELVQTLRGAAPVARSTPIPTTPLTPARREDFPPSSRRNALGAVATRCGGSRLRLGAGADRQPLSRPRRSSTAARTGDQSFLDRMDLSSAIADGRHAPALDVMPMLARVLPKHNAARTDVERMRTLVCARGKRAYIAMVDRNVNHQDPAPTVRSTPSCSLKQASIRA